MPRLSLIFTPTMFMLGLGYVPRMYVSIQLPLFAVLVDLQP